MSLLPTFALDKITAQSGGYTEPVEYEVNLETGQLTGRKVKGKEAVRMWIWLCLHTERFRHPIFSWNYGTELEQYIGQTLTQEFLETDCQASVEEALMINPYINEIRDFQVTIEENKLLISFTAVTKFGEVEVETKV